jgi:DNA-binding PadR family transcriptional regulator
MYYWKMNQYALYKGCLEPLVMNLLKDHGRMYGYQITQLVKERTSGEFVITEGALYPLLHKLEEAGIVETEIELVGNRKRKYYTLTRAGKKQTAIALAELKTFIHSLQLVMHPKTQ